MIRGRNRWIGAIFIVATCGPWTLAVAAPPTVEEMQQAFFHLSVTGEPVEPGAADREGKAFAIGPGLLITSRHIVGEEGDWKARSDLDPEIARATSADDRTLKLYPSASELADDLGANALVSPGEGGGVDIAEVTLPDANLEHYFGLSMCAIRSGQPYGVLLGTREQPSDPASVKRPAIVKLQATGYDVPRYGGLFVFDLAEDNQVVEWETDGHEGSPIFDEDGNVVGIVSAITLTASGDHRILATPMQSPLLSAISAIDQGAPGTPPRSVKCSLADTVKRINDLVLAYARWTLDVVPGPDGKPSGELLMRYESVADYPNIDSVLIEHDYWGKQRSGNDTRLTRLTYFGDDPRPLPLKGSVDEKVFDASAVIDEGKRLVQPYLDETGGKIQYVEIRIISTKLTDGRDITKVTTLRFDWGQP